MVSMPATVIMGMSYSVIILTESDGTSNQYENDNLNLPSTYRSRRNSRGFRDRPSPR